MQYQFKKLTILKVFTVFVILLTAVRTSYGQFSGGSGSAQDPFQIAKTADWHKLMRDPNYWGQWPMPYHFIMKADLDFQGATLTPIDFAGHFNGAGHIIRNIVINQPDKDYVGLFGVLNNGHIRNLGLENVNVTGRNDVGGLAGGTGSWMAPSSITSCYTSGIVHGNDTVGGLVGFNSYCPIEGCHSTGTVNGLNNVGGLVGYNYEGKIHACYASGAVHSTGIYAGGLLGYTRTSITSCYATGPVSGNSAVGGLVGFNYYVSINLCYSAGAVSGNDFVGGLIGDSLGAADFSYWNRETSGQDTSAGGESKTTAEMKQKSTFAGWDFTGDAADGAADLWRMCAENLDYPKLNWQFSQIGDVTCPEGLGMEDFVYLVQRWLEVRTEAFEGADINGDKIVNFLDYAVLAAFWF